MMTDQNTVTEHANQVQELIADGGSETEIMDRVVAYLHETIDRYTWVGFYLMDGEELILGPFRGKPTQHTTIALHSGICGAAASTQETVIVSDVKSDPRFIACSLDTKSEIVVPIMKGDQCLGEIDIDSDQPNAFDENDRVLLETIAIQMATVLKSD